MNALAHVDDDAIIATMARKGWHHREYLPHCDGDGLIQHVVFRLADSLPSQVMDRLSKAGDERSSEGVAAALDEGHGEALLGDTRFAEIVEAALIHFHEIRYTLIAWCVMPNHVHVVLRPLGQFALGDIVKSWKSFTALQINRMLGRAGRLWAADYFDRFMRDDRQLSATVAYVEANPVAAGLCAAPDDWRFSSAWRERARGPRS